MQKDEVIFDGLKITIYRKKIKNLYIRISQPGAEIKVFASQKISQEKIEKFINDKIDWIKKSQEKVLKQKFIPAKKILDGEFHNFFEQKFLLKTFKDSNKNLCFIREDAIELHSKKFVNFQKRQKLLDDFYRRELQKIIPKIITDFEKIMNVKVAEFGIKKMKTRWGTCNAKQRRIWINLELAKKPVSCLKYLIAHEMTHFFESKHNKNFFSLMDKFYPNWQRDSQILKN